MSRLKWDETGKRMYETGLDHGILFLIGNNNKYSNGIPWNGLISINESPSGAEATPLYADNIKYLNLISAEDFGATIEAYTYPDEFKECDGTASVIPGVNIGQQSRKIFGLSYRTKIGNDVEGSEHGYKLHLIYGALAAPSERSYQTINDSPEAITFSWTLSTTPIDVPGFKPVAHLEVNSLKTPSSVMKMIEDLICGRDFVPGTTSEDPIDPIDPILPTPDAILRIINAGTIYEEIEEDLLDSSGNKIFDSETEEIKARHMVIAV